MGLWLQPNKPWYQEPVIPLAVSKCACGDGLAKIKVKNMGEMWIHRTIDIAHSTYPGRHHIVDPANDIKNLREESWTPKRSMQK